MSNYWAEWDNINYNGQTTRYDTRVYWAPQTDGTVGQCVGKFYGDNPGGGKPSIRGPLKGRSSIVSGGQVGDPTLRLIHEIWQLAVNNHGKRQPKEGDYIEILNTYYFANGVAGVALPLWLAAGGPGIYYPTPSLSSKFVLLGWGMEHNSPYLRNIAQQLLVWHPKVLVPNSQGNVVRMLGCELSKHLAIREHFPAAPSYFIRSRTPHLLPTYKTEVAKNL